MDSSAGLFSEDDIAPALLQFMIAATPNQDVINDILGNYEEYLEGLDIAPQLDGFAPTDDESLTFYVYNVPDTVNPVKGTLAYVQVPNKRGDGTDLNLVYKVSHCRTLSFSHFDHLLFTVRSRDAG